MSGFSRILVGVSCAAVAVVGVALPASAAPCGAPAFGPSFVGSYSCNDLGTPAGFTGSLGGLTFLDNDTLLIGSAANSAVDGAIRQIDVTRGVGNHITSFAGASSAFSTAPRIDGGLTFEPGGVLLFTGFPTNTVGQIKPGSVTPDKTVGLTLPGVTPSVGTLAFVPTGFAGAGKLKIASFSTSEWYTATLTPDGSGTFDVTAAALETTIFGGPEGIVYVAGANAGFGGSDSVLVSEFIAGRISAYTIDSNGDPLPGSRQDFLSGLSGAEGAVVDPLTGDFLFSTFGGSNRVLVISGFLAPEAEVPGPATLVLVGAGLVTVAVVRRRRAA